MVACMQFKQVDIFNMTLLNFVMTEEEIGQAHDASAHIKCITKEKDALNRRRDRDNLHWRDANGHGCNWCCLLRMFLGMRICMYTPCSIQ